MPNAMSDYPRDIPALLQRRAQAAHPYDMGRLLWNDRTMIEQHEARIDGLRRAHAKAEEPLLRLLWVLRRGHKAPCPLYYAQTSKGKACVCDCEYDKACATVDEIPNTPATDGK